MKAMLFALIALTFCVGCSSDTSNNDAHDTGLDLSVEDSGPDLATTSDASLSEDTGHDVGDEADLAKLFELITSAGAEPTSCEAICASASLDCYTRELVGFSEYVGEATYSDESFQFLGCKQVPPAETQNPNSPEPATLETIECSCH